MATAEPIVQSAQQTKTPLLQQCLTELAGVVAELAEVGNRYVEAKRILGMAQEDPNSLADLGGAQLFLQLGRGEPIPMPLATAGPELVNLLAQGVNQLSGEYMRLWGTAHEITGRASTHCQAAVARYQATAAPTQQ